VKIILGKKFLGEKIIEAFLVAMWALVDLNKDGPYDAYKRYVKSEELVAIEISPEVKYIWTWGVELVPQERSLSKKYILFGPETEKWWPDYQGLWVKLRGILKKEEYSEVDIDFTTGVFDYEKPPALVIISPEANPEKFDNFKDKIEKFLKKFNELLNSQEEA
jgi:hypothetical protein